MVGHRRAGPANVVFARIAALLLLALVAAPLGTAFSNPQSASATDTSPGADPVSYTFAFVNAAEIWSGDRFAFRFPPEYTVPLAGQGLTISAQPVTNVNCWIDSWQVENFADPNTLLWAPLSTSSNPICNGGAALSFTMGGIMNPPAGTYSIGVDWLPDSATAQGRGTGDTSTAYEFTIEDPNEAPSISTLSPASAFFFLGTQASVTVTFTLADDHDACDVLALSVSSDRPALATTALSGSGCTRTLTITPVPHQTGAATISVTAVDSGGLASPTRTFSLTIRPIVTVNTLADPDGASIAVDGACDDSGDGTCSLREAILEVNALAPHLDAGAMPEIRFSSSVFPACTGAGCVPHDIEVQAPLTISGRVHLLTPNMGVGLVGQPDADWPLLTVAHTADGLSTFARTTLPRLHFRDHATTAVALLGDQSALSWTTLQGSTFTGIATPGNGAAACPGSAVLGTAVVQACGTDRLAFSGNTILGAATGPVLSAEGEDRADVGLLVEQTTFTTVSGSTFAELDQHGLLVRGGASFDSFQNHFTSIGVPATPSSAARIEMDFAWLRLSTFTDTHGADGSAILMQGTGVLIDSNTVSGGNHSEGGAVTLRGTGSIRNNVVQGVGDAPAAPTGPAAVQAQDAAPLAAVWLDGSGSVGGNTIGVADGVCAGNAGAGIRVSGGHASLGHPFTANTIGCATGHGIWLEAHAGTPPGISTVRGQFIGTDAAGNALGNGGHGIFVDGLLTAIGLGNAADANSIPTQGNTIAYNGGSGVHIAAGLGVRVAGNAIHSNRGLGIDLAGGEEDAFGVTANGPRDATGPNALQQHPRITFIDWEAGAVAGTLAAGAVPATSGASLHLHSAGACDPSGHGEGAAFVGLVALAPSARTWAVPVVSADLPATAPWTALITTNDGTSEFGACVVDTDRDGLPDDVEVALGTDPYLPDTDGDGLRDAEEARLGPDGPESPSGTNATLHDTDDDGIPDGQEVHVWGSDPADPASPGLHFTWDPARILRGHDVTFTPVDSSPCAHEYTWADGDGGQIGQGAPFAMSFPTTGPTVVTLEATPTPECPEVRQATAALVVHEPMRIQVGADDVAVAAADETIQLAAIGAPAESSWLDEHTCLLWDFGDGGSAANQSVTHHMFTQAGNRSVRLHAHACGIDAEGYVQGEHIETAMRSILVVERASHEQETPGGDVVVERAGSFRVHYKASQGGASVTADATLATEPGGLQDEVLPLAEPSSGVPRVQGLRYLEVHSTQDGVEEVEIRIQYNASEVEAAGIQPASLALWYWNGTMWHNTLRFIGADIPGQTPEQDLHVFDAGRNETGEYVWAVVDHTSTYSLGGVTAAPRRSGGGGAGAPATDTPPADAPDGAAPDATEAPPDEPQAPDAPTDATDTPSVPVATLGAPAGPGAGAQGSWKSMWSHEVVVHDAGGRELGALSALQGTVRVASDAATPDTAWVLVRPDGTAHYLLPAGAPALLWETSQHDNGAYAIQVRQGDAILAQRTVVVDNPTVAAATAAGALLVAVAGIAIVSISIQGVQAALGQAAKEAALTLGEDRLRTRAAGKRVWQARTLLRSILVAAAALLLLALAFSAEEMASWDLGVYADNLRAAGLATVSVFTFAYLLEAIISHQAGLRLAMRFLPSGFVGLVVSTLAFRLPFGYPAFIEDGPRDGEEELPASWDALRNVAIVLAPLALLLPLLLARPSAYGYADAAMEIVAVEVLVASLPIAPLPGAAVWAYRKSWSGILVAGVTTLFVMLRLGAPPAALLVTLAVLAAVLYGTALAALTLRHRRPEAGIVVRVDRWLATGLPGRLHETAVRAAAGVDALVARAAAAGARPAAHVALRWQAWRSTRMHAAAPAADVEE